MLYISHDQCECFKDILLFFCFFLLKFVSTSLNLMPTSLDKKEEIEVTA